MIKHIVSWKLLAEDAEGKADSAAQIAAALQSLPPLIPQIRSLVVGPNVLETEVSFDVALIVEVDDLDALAVYQVHPEHKRVAGIIAPLARQRVSVDIVA